MPNRPIYVLYLDDSPAALSEVSLALSLEGHIVRVGATVGECVPWLPATDIAIIDYHMPGTNGTLAVRELKRHVPAGSPGPLYYLYTVDTHIALEFRAHGFHGAFTDKGNTATLSSQFATAARLLMLRRFVKERPRPG